MALWFSGAACKWRVFKKLRHEFPSPIEAERHLRSDPGEVSPMEAEDHLLRTPDISQEQLAATPSQPTSPPRSVTQARGLCESVLTQMEAKDQLQVIGQWITCRTEI